jgi:hypothetical protein
LAVLFPGGVLAGRPLSSFSRAPVLREPPFHRPPASIEQINVAIFFIN